MGCCQARRDDSPLAGLQRIKQFDILKQFPMKFGPYTDEELKIGIDCQVVCVTKPELSYVLHLETDQLLHWSLQNLEERVINDFKDHMIESFRLSQQRQIQKKYYNSKLLEFIDLLPLYVELSGDESLAWLEVEIEHSRSVLVLPYESSISLGELKKKIAGRVDLSLSQFELHLLERPLVLDDMILSDCGISANCKLRLVQHDDSQNDLSTINTSEWQGKSSVAGKKENKQIKEEVNLDDMPELKKEEILSNFSEISMIKYGGSGEQQSVGQSLSGEEENEKIAPGLSIQVQCNNMSCHQYGLRQILPFAYGEFLFSASKSSTPLNCVHCTQPALPFQLLFFHCTYIVSGISRRIQSKQLFNSESQQQAQSTKEQDNNQILDPKQFIPNPIAKDLGTASVENNDIESSNLIKFNQGQLISTDGEALENFSLDCENSEWKQLRVRVRSYIKQSLVCGLCTIPIIPQREKQASLLCNHMYHSACLARFQQQESNSRCVFCVF